MPRTPGWLIRDQASDSPRPRPTPEEQGRVLVDVIEVAEAISLVKGTLVKEGPLTMPLLRDLRSSRMAGGSDG